MNQPHATNPEQPRSPIARSLGRFFHDLRIPRGDALVFVLLGSVALFLIAVEAVTGVLLALYFRPTALEANASVRFIVTEVEFGAMVRSIHVWGAHGLIALLIAIVGWALVRRAYGSPHAPVWSCGVALLFVELGEAFTGGLLPWTRTSAIDAEVSSTLASQLPLIGPALRALMLGRGSTDDIALVRILGMHAGALPMLTTALVLLIGLHTVGSAPPRGSPAFESALPIAPDVRLRVAAICAIAAMLLLAVSSAFAPGLGASAASIGALPALRPAWFLLFIHGALRAAPATMLGFPGARVVATLFAVLAALALVFPMLDRKSTRTGQVIGLVVFGTLLEETLRVLLE